MDQICATRALKNARRIQSVAPNIIPAKEPAAGFTSLVPFDVLSRFHQMTDAELASHPELLEAAKALRKQEGEAKPNVAIPLFQGTLYFVRMLFYVEPTNTDIVAVNIGDVQTAIQYATLAAVPISEYASQYGPNNLEVSQTMLNYGIAVTNLVYNDDTVRAWVNDILNQNKLAAGSSCIVILNPPRALNTDADATKGIQGYHGKANSPYCFVNVHGSNFTVADPPDNTDKDHFALFLSHEVAEMTVDPDASSNPEVCDPCGPNCQKTWRDYFVVPSPTPTDSYLTTSQDWPPPFQYSFFINGIVQPASASSCPAPGSACQYGPPPPQGSGAPRVVLYDKQAGQADVVGFDVNGQMNLDTTNSGWRGSWDMIVPGNFARIGQQQILLYDRAGGAADVVGFDAAGRVNLDFTNDGWRTSWDIIVAGDFVGNGLTQVLLYDRAAGQADVVGFASTGKTNLDYTNSGWRGSWDLIVVGSFLGNGRDQILLYDHAAGQADVVGFDNTGKTNLDYTNSGWRGSWNIIVPGSFVGNGKSQILLYDRGAGQADVVGFDSTGKTNLDTTNSGWRGSWDLIVTGEYVGNGQRQILLYDRGAGQADVVGFDSTGKTNLDNTNSGWRGSWDVIVAGNFVPNGRNQVLLYDRVAGQADVVGFNNTGGTNLDTTNSGWRTSWTEVIALL